MKHSKIGVNREKVNNLFSDPTYKIALRRISKELKRFVSPEIAIKSLKYHKLI